MYKIQITKVETEKKTVTGQYQVIDTRPYTEKELNDAFSGIDFKTELKEVRGYAPDTVKEVTIERDVLTQTVDDLDLVAVIKAINKIKDK